MDNWKSLQRKNLAILCISYLFLMTAAHQPLLSVHQARHEYTCAYLLIRTCLWNYQQFNIDRTAWLVLLMTSCHFLRPQHTWNVCCESQAIPSVQSRDVLRQNALCAIPAAQVVRRLPCLPYRRQRHWHCLVIHPLIACFRTLMFYKVVCQHMQGVAGFLVISLLQKCHGILQWKI